MGEPIIKYDQEADVLYITFRPGEKAMGLSLTEHILLRFHPETREAVGLTLMDFSVLVQPTDVGPRSFALTGLDNLPSDLRETVITLLTTPPVNSFLKVSSFAPSPRRRFHLTYVERPVLVRPGQVIPSAPTHEPGISAHPTR
jgi:uncharacterized protein YuzE